MPTHRLGLVGSGIDMSLAPAFHQLAGELLDLDVTYELIPCEPDEVPRLGDLLRRLGAEGYQGLNVTVPFKSTASQAASHPSPEVVATGAANTLLLGPGGPTHAFNTDLTGFKWAYRRRFGTAPPGTVAVLGAGGVGTATAAALVDLGAGALRVFDLVPDRARRLVRRLRSRAADADVDLGVTVAASAEAAVDGADGVVNGTPVGMSWQPGTPVDLDVVEGQRWVFDAVYSPVETPLMVRAAAAGLARITGFDLFLGQAIDAFEIFTGRTLPAPVLAELESSLGVLERERDV